MVSQFPFVDGVCIGDSPRLTGIVTADWPILWDGTFCGSLIRLFVRSFIRKKPVNLPRTWWVVPPHESLGKVRIHTYTVPGIYIHSYAIRVYARMSCMRVVQVEGNSCSVAASAHPQLNACLTWYLIWWWYSHILTLLPVPVLIFSFTWNR